MRQPWRSRLGKALTAIFITGYGVATFAEEPGIPASVVLVPSAAKPPPATLNEPAGPPRFAGELPRGTPAREADPQPPAAVNTFANALSRSYWTQPALLAERSRLRSTDFRLPQAISAYGPRLNVEGTYGYARDNVQLGSGGWFARSGFSSTASAILTQPVFTFGRAAAGEREAQAQIAFQRSVLRSSELQTLFNAIRAYAGVLRERSALNIVREDLALLEREYGDNTARFAQREVTATDVQQIATRLEQSRAQLFAAQRAVASSDAVFLAAVGALPATDLAPPNPLGMPAATLEEAYAYGATHSPVLGAAYARERISRAQRDGARADMLPRVDLRGRADYGSVSPYSDDLRQTSLRGEVVISAPIFESGLRRARVGEASAANDADWRLIDSALRENRADIADAWNEWLSQTASIAPLKAASEAAQLAFEGALLQERAGLRTTLDVLQLARELLVARSSYNNATANSYVAQARLLAAMGALEHRWLFPGAPAYDPDDHYRRTRNDGTVPILTPLVRALDSMFVGGGSNRAIRDPSAPVAAAGVQILVPQPVSVPPLGPFAAPVP